MSLISYSTFTKLILANLAPSHYLSSNIFLALFSFTFILITLFLWTWNNDNFSFLSCSFLLLLDYGTYQPLCNLEPSFQGSKREIVKITEGKLNFYFIFSFYFLFLFHFRSIFYFRVRVRVTKITLSHSRSHQMTQSQVTWHKRRT